MIFQTIIETDMSEEGNKMNNKNKATTRQQFEYTVDVLFDSFPEPVFIIDREGTIIAANGAFAARFSVDTKECVGENVYDMLLPEHAGHRRKMAEEVLHTGKQLFFEDIHDGQIYRSTIYPVRSSEGEITRLLIIAQNVSSHKRIEQEVKNNHVLIQTLIDASPGIFCMIDANGRFTAWNASMRNEILCKSEIEIAGTDAIAIIYPDDRPLIEEKMHNVFNEGLEEHAEVRVLFSGGQKFRWFFLRAKRVVIDGNPFLIATGTDIDERKQAEYALELSEKKFRSITEQLDGEIFICDSEGFFTYVSPACENISGFLPQEIIGHRFTEFFVEKDIPMAIDVFFAQLSGSSQKMVFEHRLKRKNGSNFWGEVHVQNYESGTIGMLFDITRRKHDESLTVFRLRVFQMAESHSVEELLRAIVDEAEQLTESAIGFCHFIGDDPAFSFLRVESSNHQKSTHWPNGNTPHPSLFTDSLWSDAISSQQAVITNDYSSRESHGVEWPDGHPEIRRTLVVPMHHGGKVLAILGVGNKLEPYDDHDLKLMCTLTDIALDIVSRKRAELRMHEMQEALIHSQKMDLVGQLAGGIAHDFNNMLGVILGNIEMALDQMPAPDESLQYNLRNILEAVNRSADLTRQLLAFSRKDNVMPIVLELNALVEKMIIVLRELIGENITINWRPDTDRALVKADPSQIEQILVNLCVNARDAITGVGLITIEIGKYCDLNNRYASDNPRNVPADYVTISITDNGKGIEREHFPHIFEPFFTTKKKGKGAGMGLSTVYGIVKQCKGTIECRSQEGKGTTFKIFLPRHQNEVFAAPEKPEQASIVAKYGKETILLVENEPEILHLCQVELEKKGYRVLAAAAPDAAIQLAVESKEAIKLLLTDVVMPGMNGCDLFKVLQEYNPSLKVLFMSGYSSDIVADKDLIDERVNFIQKPFSLKSLSIMVQKILIRS